MTKRKPTPENLCRQCGKQIERKRRRRINPFGKEVHQLESISHFMKRVFCSMECMALDRSQNPMKNRAKVSSD